MEVESFENQKSDLDEFLVAKIITAEKHPNADRLSLCDVDIGKDKTVKVVQHQMQKVICIQYTLHQEQLSLRANLNYQ